MNRLPSFVERIFPASMFWSAAAFLLFLGIELHLNPPVDHGPLPVICLAGMALLYPLFMAELIVHLALGTGRWRRQLLFCLLPPLRIAARDLTTGQSIWFPWCGWVTTDRSLREKVERAFSGPMIAIALLMLPLLAVEHFYAAAIETNTALAIIVNLGTGLIWTAFTFEFIVLASIVPNKLRYCKENWVNLAIILFPLLSFARVFRLARLARLQALSKLTRVYRLRGLSMRLYRAVLVLNVFRYLLGHNPEKRLVALRRQLEEKEHELDRLRQEIAEMEKQLEPQLAANAILADSADGRCRSSPPLANESNSVAEAA